MIGSKLEYGSLRRRPLLEAAALPFVVTVLSCSASLPGTMLGTYHVVGKSQVNSCGGGLMSPDPWTFTVQLSKSGSTLYWSWMDGRPLLSGVSNEHAQASLTTTETANVDGTDAGQGPCTMRREDDVAITLGAGESPGSFDGTIRYGFSASSGSDCTDQLSARGGRFDALPCAVTYSISAARQ